MMSRGRVIAMAVAAVALLAGAVGYTRLASDDAPAVRDELADRLDRWTFVPARPFEMEWEGPPGAEAIAGGGDVRTEEGGPDAAAEVGSDQDEIDLQSAGRVLVDEDGGVWLLSYLRVIRLADGRVDGVYSTPVSTSSMAVGPGGELYVAGTSAYSTLDVYESESSNPRTVADLGGDSLAVDDAGRVLVGSYNADRPSIVAVSPDGEEQDLLPSTLESPDGRVPLVAVLSDGRVAFALKESPDDFVLWVLDDGEMQMVGGNHDAAARRRATTLAPAPDGGLLVTAGDQIERVDVDTGESETLVDLAGAEGTFSAAADGNDLVFLADGRLWRMADAFG